MALDSAQRRALVLMAGVVVALHATGFLLLVLLASGHRALAGPGGLALGTGLTAYTLGLRHAFDADHISAIDNTTRKLIGDGQRPLSTGFFFSLGHSTVVFVLALLLGVGIRSVGGQLMSGHSALHGVADWVGTGVSGAFLYLIAAINFVLLLGIVRMLGEMRGGRLDEAQLEDRLASRGLMNRVFGRWCRVVSRPWQMYPIGILFGLGFDTATEVGLLLLAAGAAGAALPFLAVLCLPILFAAGMSLLDTIDGAFMNLAYGWAFARPVRKVFYNLTITGLSVIVALVIGTIELVGLVAHELGAQGPFWTWSERVNLNTIGLVICAAFLLTWAVAVAVWRLGRIEERFSPPSP